MLKENLDPGAQRRINRLKQKLAQICQDKKSAPDEFYKLTVKISLGHLYYRDHLHDSKIWRGTVKILGPDEFCKEIIKFS